MVARSIFSELPTGTPGDIEDDRGLYERTYYSQRGLVYKSTRTDQPQDISSTNANDVIGTWIWYDAAGRPIKQFSANSPVVKRKYDGHGRTVAMYLSDGGGDGGVGGSYSHATHVNSDEVIEQTKYEFDTQSGDWPGQLTLATTWRRLHDAAGTGELTAAGTSPTAIATYTGYYYDDASRPLRTVSFGTSSSSDTFEAGTSAPSWPPSSVPTMTSHPNAIVTGVKYDVQGRIYESIDTLGRVSRTFFDDLGRTIAISENFDDASVSWNGTALNWEVDGLDRTEPDVDRVTTYAYDASGGLWKQTAHIPDPDPMAPATDVLAQVTEYVRTHTAASSPSTLLTSNSIVHEIRYPDETTGLAGTGAQYRVAYKYNRLGELIEFTDQNATVHAYERDSLGRLTADKVSAFGSQIDDRIKRIDTSYDTFGRLERVTSLTSTTDTAAVANEVAYTYTALWQVSDLYQNAGESVYTSGGSVRSSTKRVQYHHETGYPLDDDYKNYSRLKKISYPSKPVGSTVDETELIYEYLEGTSSDGLDARVSRPIALKVSNQVTSGSSMLAAYERIGMGMYAIVDYPLVGGEGLSGVQLDRTLAHDSTGAVAVGSRRFSSYAAADLKGVYPGLDRFGRTKTQAWVDGLLTVHATNDAVPNRPPIVLERYGYDAASNPLTRLDARPGAHLVNRDFAFSYDALDRLVGSDRGVASTSTWGKAGTQDWSLDMLGNWSQFRWDRNGDGDFDEGAETEQREHNLANEILSRVQENPLPLSDTTLNLTHDHAGNMRTKYESSVVRMELTHDAWNRLVRIRRLTSNIEDPPLDVSEQEFNGLHWRVVSREDTDADGTLDEKRELVYSSSWQVLEEFVDEDYVSSPGTDRRVQQFWGLRHLDDAIMSREQDPVSGEIGRTSYKLTDRQFSVVAVLDVSGELMERVTYDPYGRAQHRWPADFNGDGYMDGTDTGSASLFTSIGASGYRADEDLNRDGVTDIDDMVIAYLWGSKGPLPSGQISDPAGPGNRVGYAGYRFEPSSTLYHVRFRWYDTGLGRWAQRDPAGYIDGMGLYQYVSAIPTASHDSMGLWPRKYHGMSKQQQARLERAFNKAVANAREMRKQVPSLREDLRALDPCVADIMEPLISQLDDRLSTLISGFESSDNEIHVRDSAFKMLSLRGKGIPNAETRQHFPTVSEMGNAVLYPPYYSITLAAKKQTPDLYDWNSWDDDKLAVQIFHELVHVSEYEVGDPDFDRNESVLVNAVHMEETIANGNVDIRSGTAMLRLFDAAKRECGCDSKKPRP
jgi:RHS repeat-associated protein